jgi:serine/threonine protein kinase
MGTVYRASHALLKRPTAIKLIAPDRASETATARFEREVLAASRLSHPNTVAIYDFGRTRGSVFYYAMELLDGQDLSRLVEHEGPQSVEVCIAHAQAVPDPPSKYASLALPLELDALVLRCLEKDPQERPTTRALADLLDAMRFEAAHASGAGRHRSSS